jgi:transposase InsO family protein
MSLRPAHLQEKPYRGPAEEIRRGLLKFPAAARAIAPGSETVLGQGLPYIRLKWEFVYLAVILDAFSREVVGWELGETLAVRW